MIAESDDIGEAYPCAGVSVRGERNHPSSHLVVGLQDQRHICDATFFQKKAFGGNIFRLSIYFLYGYYNSKTNRLTNVE
jgi:hypothetical protein